MKRAFTLITTLLLVASLSACSNKTDTSDIEETTPVESTEDPFSLGHVEIDVNETTSSTLETTSPEETAIAEIIETQADGTATGRLANGDYFVEFNTPGHLAENGTTQTQVAAEQDNTSSDTTDDNTTAEQPTQSVTQPSQPAVENNYEINQNNEMSESELTTYDMVVSFWAENPDLSEEYLEEMLGSADRFPSLSDFQRQNMIKEIKERYPHDPSETRAYDTYFNAPTADSSQSE